MNHPTTAMLLLLTTVFIMPSVVAADKTPSHVYQQVAIINGEIDLLRTAFACTETPRKPGEQISKLPLHVYSKSIEIAKKLAKIEDQVGLKKSSIPILPLHKVTPSEVFTSTQQTLAMIHRIKAAKGITATVTDIPLPEGKTPSDVYEHMWEASFKLDEISGKIKPSDVFGNAGNVLLELAIIERHYKITNTVPESDVNLSHVPRDVGLIGFKALRTFPKIEKKIGLKAFRVRPFPEGKIAPEDVFEITNMLLCECVRVKIHLGIKEGYQEAAPVDGKKPGHVFVRLEQAYKRMQVLYKHLKKNK